MVRKLLWLAPVMLAVASCTDPISATQDPVVQYPQVQFDSYYLQTWMRVQPPAVDRVGAGQLHVVVPIRNRTDEDRSLDYKYYFTDKNGVQVESPSGWQLVKIPRKGIEQFEFTSLSAAPQDFRVELREAK